MAELLPSHKGIAAPMPGRPQPSKPIPKLLRRDAGRARQAHGHAGPAATAWQPRAKCPKGKLQVIKDTDKEQRKRNSHLKKKRKEGGSWDLDPCTGHSWNKGVILSPGWKQKTN